MKRIRRAPWCLGGGIVVAAAVVWSGQLALLACAGRAGGPVAGPVEEAVPDPGWRLSIVLRRQTADDAVQDVPLAEAAVADLALQPLSLALRGVPFHEEAAAASSPAIGFGAMSGALGGGAPASGGGMDGVRYRGTFRIGDEVVPVPEWAARCDRPDACVRHEWLELTLAAPGREARVVRRDLFVATGPGDFPPAFRRYSLLVAPGRVAREELRSRLEAARDAFPTDADRSALERLAADPGSAGGEHAALDGIAGLDERVGAAAGQLLLLAFAAESDELTGKLAAASGVVVAREFPRLLLAAVESGRREGEPASVAIDLRLDEVTARPAPGRPDGAARLFQLARGMLESTLEGEALRHAAGGEAATTAGLMTGAERAGVEIRLVRPADRAGLPPDLPGPVATLVAETLDRGHEVAIPARAVALAGRPRWGWWDIDPASGALVGVMEDGQHQGMVEVTVTTQGASLNENYAFAIGMHTGAVTVEFAVAAGMLAWGAVTEEMLDEVEALVSTAACYSCAKLELKTELKVELGNECWEWTPLEETPLQVGAQAGLGFCESYAKGFQCASGYLLAALRGEEPPGLEVGGPIALTIGCDVDQDGE